MAHICHLPRQHSSRIDGTYMPFATPTQFAYRCPLYSFLPHWPRKKWRGKGRQANFSYFRILLIWTMIYTLFAATAFKFLEKNNGPVPNNFDITEPRSTDIQIARQIPYPFGHCPCCSMGHSQGKNNTMGVYKHQPVLWYKNIFPHLPRQHSSRIDGTYMPFTTPTQFAYRWHIYAI